MKKLVENKYNIARMLLASLLLVTVIFAVNGIVTYAEDPPAATGHNLEDVENELGGKALTMPKLAARLWFKSKASMQNIAQDVGNRVKLNPNDENISTTLWNALIPLAELMAIMYFLIEMNEAIFRAQSSWSIQQLGGPLLKLGAMFMVIENGQTIVNAVKEAGNGFIDVCLGSLTPENTTTVTMDQATLDMMKDLKIGTALIFVIATLIIWVATSIVKFIFIYKSIVYKIELILRISFTPVIMGDFWEGKHSNGVRWLKKLFGCFMYGGSFILILIIGQHLGTTISLDGLTGDEDIWDSLLSIVYGCVVPIAMVGTLGAAKSACMEIMS